MIVTPRPLAGTAFAEAWLNRDPAALALLPVDPDDPASYRTRAAEVDARFDAASRAQAAAHLFGGGRDAPARIEAFVRDGGYMVTTGQQPGLFGGPLYALYKALTAAAIARRLEAMLERPVLPVFWVASEHSAWEELAHAHAVDRENRLQEITLAPPEGLPNRPVHRLPLGPDLGPALDRFVGCLPESDFLPRWRALLDEAYAPGATLPSAFALLLRELLGEAGVFLVHAHEPGLKERSLPLLRRELEESEAREAELAAFETRLRKAGWEPQVPCLSGATNLFFEGKNGRERLFREGNGLRLRGSEQRLTAREVLERAEDDPSLLSPNVLLRPAVESALLPTLTYVGGPGEIAYFPHARAVFSAHGLGEPMIHPRASLWVLEAKVSKVLDKFDLEVGALARPAHEVVARLAREEIPPPIAEVLAELRDALGAGGDRLARAVLALDPTLRGPAESLVAHGGKAVDEFERKVVQAVKRTNEVALAQVEKVQVHLFPLGVPQERVFNPFYYLARYDEVFLRQVNEAASTAVRF